MRRTRRPRRDVDAPSTPPTYITVTPRVARYSLIVAFNLHLNLDLDLDLDLDLSLNRDRDLDLCLSNKSERGSESERERENESEGVSKAREWCLSPSRRTSSSSCSRTRPT